MILPNKQSYSHSATVAATLIIGEQQIPLAKVSPEKLFFARGVSFEPGPATIELQIDGKVRNLKVRVLQPVLPFDDAVAIRQV